MGLSLSLSLSLSSHSADRPLPRQINGYMAYRKVVFADEQANACTYRGIFSCKIYSTYLLQREYGRARLERRGGGYRLRIRLNYGAVFSSGSRPSERANARHAGATQRRELVAKNGRRRRERRGKAKEQTLYSLLRHLSPYVLAFPCLQLFPSFCPVSPLFPSFQLCLLTPSLPTNGPTTNRRLCRPSFRFVHIWFRFQYQLMIKNHRFE